MKIITRNQWNALSPLDPPRKMVSTADGIFVHHTVSAAPVKTDTERAEMRNLQHIAFSRGFNDISYSFIVFPSGRIYEGRGLHIEGAHTLGYNDSAYGIAAAGNYETSRPTNAMLEAFRWLRRDYLALKTRPLRPHSNVYPTACPGKFLIAKLPSI